jgi:hypothetical protein
MAQYERDVEGPDEPEEWYIPQTIEVRVVEAEFMKAGALWPTSDYTPDSIHRWCRLMQARLRGSFPDTAITVTPEEPGGQTTVRVVDGRGIEQILHRWPMNPTMNAVLKAMEKSCKALLDHDWVPPTAR